MEKEDWKEMLPEVEHLIEKFHNSKMIMITVIGEKKTRRYRKIGPVEVDEDFNNTVDADFDVTSYKRTLFTREIHYVYQEPGAEFCNVKLHGSEICINENMEEFLKRIDWEVG